MNGKIKFIVFLTVMLSIINICKAQEVYTISGFIKNKSSGEELIGATVFVKELNTGGVSNVYGFYSITIPGGNYELHYSYMGFKRIVLKLNLTKNVKHDIELAERKTELDEVVVRSEAANKNIISTEMGTIKLDPKSMKSIPVIFGEQDILKTIQLTPGVKSSGEGNSGFFVRGGTIDQNLILLDEAPVYNASHLLGFFSVFNSDAIKNAVLIKGSIPAEYGGRISSVLDINMNEGNSKELGVTGGIGLISSRLTVEHPIVKDKGAFILSGRRSYADAFLKLSNDENRQNIELYFYDFNVKANYRINQNNRTFVSGYFGRDVFNFADRFGFDWGNATSTIRWNHLFNDKLFSNTSIIYSDYDYKFGNEAGDRRIDISSGIKDINVKQDFTFYLNPKNTLKFGFNGLHHTFYPGELSTSDTSKMNDIILEERYSVELAAYFSNDYKLNNYISFSYGLRYSYFNLLGPGIVYTFDDEGNILNEKGYSNNESIISYDCFEPRIGINYIINSENSIKTSYSKNSQYLHLLSKSTSSTPSDLWIPSSNNIEPLIADQISLGYFKNYNDNVYESSLEVYYKDMLHLIDYKNGADLTLNETVESQIVHGNGRAYGMELSIEKTKGKFKGWINYTISRTEGKFDQINDGSWFPSTQDRTHDISIVGSYQLSQKLTIAANWVFTSGNPVTFPSGKYVIDDHVVNYYTERNGYRMPDYHRLDLSLTYMKRKTEKWESNWAFSIYNVYARKNAYAIYFQVNEDNPLYSEALQLSLFSIVPSVTYNFKF
ncbi:carboxypeptidase-like regulatory domain-containing protein [Bacteroidota bacterium]